jgi:hypothetical protein
MSKTADNSFPEVTAVRRLAISLAGLLDRILDKACPSYALVAAL